MKKVSIIILFSIFLTACSYNENIKVEENTNPATETSVENIYENEEETQPSQTVETENLLSVEMLEIPAIRTVLKDTELDCTGAKESSVIQARYDDGQNDSNAFDYVNEGRDKILQKLLEFVPASEQKAIIKTECDDEYIAIYAYGSTANGVLQWGERYVEMGESFIGKSSLWLPEVHIVDIDMDGAKEVCTYKSDSSSITVYKKEDGDIVSYYMPSTYFMLFNNVKYERLEDGYNISVGKSKYVINLDNMEQYSDEYGRHDPRFRYYDGAYHVSTICGVGFEGGNPWISHESLICLNGKVVFSEGIFTIGDWYLSGVNNISSESEISEERYYGEDIEVDAVTQVLKSTGVPSEQDIKLIDFMTKDELPEEYEHLEYFYPNEAIVIYMYGKAGEGVLQWGDCYVDMEECFIDENIFIEPQIWICNIDNDADEELCIYSDSAVGAGFSVYEKATNGNIIKYRMPELDEYLDEYVVCKKEEDIYTITAGNSSYDITVHWGGEEYNRGKVEYYTNDGSVYFKADYSVNSTRYEGGSIGMAAINGKVSLQDGVFHIGRFFISGK